MKFEHLSDHAGDLLRRTKAEQATAARNAELRHDRHARALTELRDARRDKPLWKRLFAMATPAERVARSRLTEARRQLHDSDDRQSELEQQAAQQTAGVQGERELASWLTAKLSDDWTGFGGYRNRRGEADLVLVGPPGIWVVEVKNRNARLYADGIRWHYEKLDRWNNVVGNGAATDRKGRTWGQQASQVADALGSWLDDQETSTSIRSAVVLTHDRASVAAVRNPGVDLVTADRGALLRSMNGAEPTLDPTDRSRLVKLIRRDHRFHNDRPKQGSRS